MKKSLILLVVVLFMLSCGKPTELSSDLELSQKTVSGDPYGPVQGSFGVWRVVRSRRVYRGIVKHYIYNENLNLTAEYQILTNPPYDTTYRRLLTYGSNGLASMVQRDVKSYGIWGTHTEKHFTYYDNSNRAFEYIALSSVGDTTHYDFYIWNSTFDTVFINGWSTWWMELDEYHDMLSNPACQRTYHQYDNPMPFNHFISPIFETSSFHPGYKLIATTQPSPFYSIIDSLVGDRIYQFTVSNDDGTTNTYQCDWEFFTWDKR